MSKNQKDNMNQDVTASVAQAIAPIDRMIPKLCTNMKVEVINNQHIVLSMFYSDNVQQASLIDRVIIDVGHAKKLSEILNKAVEKISS